MGHRRTGSRRLGARSLASLDPVTSILFAYHSPQLMLILSNTFYGVSRSYRQSDGKVAQAYGIIPRRFDVPPMR